MLSGEIITIGDEILIGQIVDTNSAWIGSVFSETGIPISRITSIGDRREEILKELDLALNRSEIVIVTGGLGPTKDDITKKTLAELFSCKMVRDMQTYEHVKEIAERRGFDFNESNKSQADVPEAAKIIKNLYGTAPAMMFQRNGHLLFSLPGVPFEMKEIISGGVIPEIKKHFSLKNVIHKSIITYGIAESVLSEKISTWEDSLPKYLHLAYLPAPTGIKLRLSAYDIDDRESAVKEIDNQFKTLKALIPINYLGDEGSSLVSVIADELKRKGKKLFVAESCTGGAISGTITSRQGASDFYLGSVTSYSATIKTGILEVPEETIRKFSVVSRETAEKMANGALKISKADYTIATTGNLGPSLDKGTCADIGTVWIAVAEKETGTTISHKITLGKLRSENIARATSQALFMLYAILKGRRDFPENTTFLS